MQTHEDNDARVSNSALERIERTGVALAAVVKCLAKTHAAATAYAHPDCDQLAAEMRDALEGAATQMESTLSELTGEIWGELPPYVQEACRVAMPDTPDEETP